MNNICFMIGRCLFASSVHRMPFQTKQLNSRNLRTHNFWDDSLIFKFMLPLFKRLDDVDTPVASMTRLILKWAIKWLQFRLPDRIDLLSVLRMWVMACPARKKRPYQLSMLFNQIEHTLNGIKFVTESHA